MNAVLTLVSTQKRCPSCAITKLATDFYRNKGNSGDLQPHCKACIKAARKNKFQNDPEFREKQRLYKLHNYHSSEKTKRSYRNRNLVNSYGITLEGAERLLVSQIGLCANHACGKEISLHVAKNNKQKAFIDHCHKTGKVRGILCISCNTALGLLEQTNKVLGLTDYLTRTTT